MAHREVVVMTDQDGCYESVAPGAVLAVAVKVDTVANRQVSR